MNSQSDLCLQSITYHDADAVLDLGLCSNRMDTIITMLMQYSIRVSAENALGEGEPSGKQTVKTLQEAPEGGDVQQG